jgi:hypothetical protein
MQTRQIENFRLSYEPGDEEAADLIGGAAAQSAALIEERWGLPAPKALHIFVMTSWLGFLFRAAPWTYWPVVLLSLPILALRMQRLWASAGGWAQRFGRRHTVGVKPPRLLLEADHGLGDQIFLRGWTPEEKVQHITCHELTHAFSDDLRLPTWLHEGMAMVSVDAFCGEQTIRPETLETLERFSGTFSAQGRQKLRLSDPQAVIYLYCRGYWLTRFIEEIRPGLLRVLFTAKHAAPELERRIAESLKEQYPNFWDQADGIVAAHYASRLSVY